MSVRRKVKGIINVELRNIFYSKDLPRTGNISPPLIIQFKSISNIRIVRYRKHWYIGYIKHWYVSKLKETPENRWMRRQLKLNFIQFYYRFLLICDCIVLVMCFRDTHFWHIFLISSECQLQFTVIRNNFVDFLLFSPVTSYQNFATLKIQYLTKKLSFEN